MSWLSKLFGSHPRSGGSQHLGVVVSGTLWNAEMAATQLQMLGVGDGMTGVASVFGMPNGLQAQTSEGRWTSLVALKGRWILVIPDDAYAHFRPEFDLTVGGSALDGRVKSSGAGGFTLSNVSATAIERLRTAIAKMPALAREEDPSAAGHAGASEKPAGRVVVGTCTSCGRELRVKASAVRPTLHLTCKCGARNVVTPPPDAGPGPPRGA